MLTTEETQTLKDLAEKATSVGHMRKEVLSPLVATYCAVHRVTYEEAIGQLKAELDLLHYHHYGTRRKKGA